MSKRGRVALLAALSIVAATLPLTPAGAATKQDPVPNYVERQALVGAKPGARGEARRAIEANGGTVVEYNGDGNFFIVKTPSAAPDWVDRMSANRAIRYAELDYIRTIGTHETAEPNDPLFGDLYGIKKIGSELAWHETTGSTGVVVGVIDTGVDYTHPDLQANMWQHPTSGAYGRDCRNDDNDPFDDHGHGTHVAGTIGAVGNNNQGVVGVNWTTKIMALKFLSSSGSGSTSDAVECLYWAIDNGAHLTSNSWGGGGFSQALYDAIKAAQGDNQLFLAAAGNDGTNNDETRPHYPSNYDLPNVVSVAATDSKDALASWSNYGAITVDLAAPGVGIKSTVPGGEYKSYSGTSMATPHVAGAAALLLARHGATTPHATLLDRIYGSVDRVAGLEGKVATGGRLNVARAIEVDTTGPAAASLSVGSTTAGSVSLSWIAPAEDDASAISSYTLRYRASGTTDPWSVVPTGLPKAPGSAETASIGGLRPGTGYDFQLVSKDNVGLTAESAVVTATTGAGDVVFSQSFDGTDAGTGWQADSPWALASEYSHTSSQAWSDSPGVSLQDPGDPYANRKNLSLYSPKIDLSSATNPVLTLWQRYELERNYDYGYVYCNKAGGSWNELTVLNGATRFHALELDLAPCAGSSDVQLRFRLTTDMSVQFDGWYIDNVLVRADSTALAISNLQASPNPFSPGTDGSKDKTTVSFTTNKAIDDWSLTISDGGTWSCTVSGTGTPSFDWYGGSAADCSGSSYVADGTYSVTANATAGSETATSWPISVGVDTVAPAIMSGPSHGNVTTSSADVSWGTDEASDSKVLYSTTSGALTSEAYDATLTTAHTVSLTGLASNTTYYYRVVSTDSAGNAVTSAESSFTTTDAPSLSVSIAGGNQTKKGPWYHKDVIVTVTDGTTAVEGASVSISVRYNSCNDSGTAVFSGSGTTGSNGEVKFTFKTRSTGTYCASAQATKSGYDAGSASADITVSS